MNRVEVKEDNLCLNRIEEAQKILPQTSISVRVNIDRTNSDEFFDVLNYFRAKKYLNVSVNPGFVNDLSERDRNQCVYDKKSMAAFLKDAYRKHNYYSRFFYPADITSTCAVRNPNAIVIGPLGELYKCWNDVGNTSRIIGYIDKEELSNKDLFVKYVSDLSCFEDEKCKNCLFFPIYGKTHMQVSPPSHSYRLQHLQMVLHPSIHP